MNDPKQKKFAVSRHHEIIDRLISAGITDVAELLKMTLAQLGSRKGSDKIREDIKSVLKKKGLLDSRSKIARLIK